MTTKLTKLALEQINSRLASENEALRKQVADLEHTATLIDGTDREVARLTHELAAAREIINSQHVPSRRVAAHMPQWQIDRAQAMTAAREMAMRCGYAVKV